MVHSHGAGFHYSSSTYAVLFLHILAGIGLFAHSLKLVLQQLCRLVALLESHGFVAHKRQWLAAWEDVWQRNLASCNDSGDCLIQLS